MTDLIVTIASTAILAPFAAGCLLLADAAAGLICLACWPALLVS